MHSSSSCPSGSPPSRSPCRGPAHWRSPHPGAPLAGLAARRQRACLVAWSRHQTGSRGRARGWPRPRTLPGRARQGKLRKVRRRVLVDGQQARSAGVDSARRCSVPCLHMLWGKTGSMRVNLPLACFGPMQQPGPMRTNATQQPGPMRAHQRGLCCTHPHSAHAGAAARARRAAAAPHARAAAHHGAAGAVDGHREAHPARRE